ncbi:hypothetical protein GXSOP10_13822 [Armatimonadetes bacterium GXS]|nr:hypothetical protein GXSOP10_13822 [Armatimonadetes bacterium GXS]
MAITAYEWSGRLRPYRWRVRMLLAWKLGAIGGTAGALTSALLSLLDWRAVLFVPTYWLPLIVLAGVLLGVVYAMLIRLPDSAIAQLIDRRAGLKDRLQTALEHSEASHLFDQPLIEDAQRALQSTHPAQIFKPRFTRWQGLFLGAVALALLMHFLPQILALALPERREEQKEIVKSAKQIEEVVKPIVEEAKKPDADEITKRIAQNAELYNKRAREAKMSKQEALLRYNQLLEDARKLEQKNTQKMSESAQKALTAGEQLEKLAQKKQQELNNAFKDLQAQLQQIQQQLESGKDLQGNPLSAEQRASLMSQMRQLQATMRAMQNPANAQNQLNDLQKQLEQLQKQLQSGKDANGNPLSKEQMEALRKQMERLQQQIRALRLSQEAQEFLRKLYNDPAFKEAMEHLRKLAEEMRKNMQQQQNPNNAEKPQLSPEEIEKRLQELEKRLEELAKKYKTDEQIHQLAQQILEQVKQMKKLNQCNGACSGLGMCFGSGGLMPSFGGGGIRQGTAWDKGEFFGQPELFNQGDKQPELKIPMKDTAVSGQQPLLPGPAEYQDFEAPPVPGGSSIPLNQALPTYQKKAEQALSQQNIPPAERKRVKRYFESLQKGGN